MTNYEICQQFAVKHGLTFEDHGLIGLDRECVGFKFDGEFIDYDPFIGDDTLLNEKEACYPPESVIDEYNRHTYLAVLVHDDNYDEAIRQLAIWVKDMSNVQVIKYATGITGLQALLSGSFGTTIKRICQP